MTTAAEQLAVPPVWRGLVAQLNGGPIQDGEPGIRDIDAPCEAFEPAGAAFDMANGTGDCQTDGHYICSECVHISLETLRTRKDQCFDCGAPMEQTQTGESCSARCDLPNAVSQ